MNRPIIKIINLKVYFKLENSILDTLLIKRANYIKAVNDISLDIFGNEALGLVGETGCGKTTFGKAILLIEKPNSGQIFYKDKDILEFSKKEKISFYKEVQMIFQNPYSSLNPRMKVKELLTRPVKRFGENNKKIITQRILEVKDLCGLTKFDLEKYPYEFSGGQRQRIAIAKALVNKPSFIIADEPTSALDVSMQSKILNLLKELKENLGLTIILISHDISVIMFICNRIAIMYLGEIVEIISKKDLFMYSRHPYTKQLIGSVPKGVKNSSVSIESNNPKKGLDQIAKSKENNCLYLSKCPYSFDECYKKTPELTEISKGHFIACHLINKK